MNEQEQMQMLMSQLQDSNLRRSVMQYINQTANGLDKDANSKALIETLARESVHNQKSTGMWKSRTKKSVAIGVVAVVLAITVQFLVNYFTNELSKESHVDQQGAMVSAGGKVVKTQMEEMKVDADGKLLSRSGNAAVKTMPSLAKVALASSLPDATLMALDEMTVHSDKGYTLQIKVHGFSRVPVLNSRCGNIVHFYTAWRGKVTLDSTDLSFDEATAAEFKNAGFSLATGGGRRLAGRFTVDGFAKALDDMREGGKWNCADIPLPTFSELGDRKETSYYSCGTKDDKDGLCYSKYGGLKIGVTALKGSLAAAMTSHTDLLTGKMTEEMFVKTSSAVMNSDLYRVSFSEYAMHPGQQLVAISDLASGKAVTFQMETDKTRSHCVVEHDQMQKANQQATKSATVDSDWHFEYLGTNEEDGRVLRHFGVTFSSEYTNFVWGEGAAMSLPNFVQFWDVAETMQPERLLLGDSITVFDSYNQSVSDLDVEAAVETRTGKSVADLMKCSDAEASDDARPEMDPFGDLSDEDGDYYQASSATKSKALAQYLDATSNNYAMPDMCYEKCKAAVDAVVSEARDICKGSMLENALLCLKGTGMAACIGSNFAVEHADECSSADGHDTVSNDTVRALEESEDALEESEDAVEVLVNETPLAMVSSRKLSFLLWQGCDSKNLFDVANRYTPVGPGKCVQQDLCKPWNWRWDKETGEFYCKYKAPFIRVTVVSPILNLLTTAYGSNLLGGNGPNPDPVAVAEFAATLGNMAHGQGYSNEDLKASDILAKAMMIEIYFCTDYTEAFPLCPDFVKLEACGGGRISLSNSIACPDVTGVSMQGEVFWTFEFGFQKDKWRFVMYAMGVDISTGVGWKWVEEKCWWDQDGNRRRRWWRRRRRTRRCNYAKGSCDYYIKARGWAGLCGFIATLSLTWWVKSSTLQMKASVKFDALLTKFTIWSKCLWEQKF